MADHSEREDRSFIGHFVREEGLRPRQVEDVVNMATGLYRYGGLQVSEAVCVARRMVLEKIRRGPYR